MEEREFIMKLRYAVFLLSICAIFTVIPQALAATVGNPIDLDIPSKSAILRQQAVNKALDEYEETVKIKAAIDLEFLFNKDLHSPTEITQAELKGQWKMLKFGVTLFDRVEPYIKVGTSNLKVKWRQGGNGSQEVTVDADSGFAWGAGVKGIIWEFEDSGLRLTGDVQYRTTGPDVGDISLNSSDVTDSGADFNIKEWQASIALSKKFELPLRWQNIYIVPYAGIDVSDSTVDVKFNDPSNPTTDYSLFDSSNDSIYGAFLGCDIMPSLTSSFIYSMELRLVNEYAFTLGGVMKF